MMFDDAFGIVELVLDLSLLGLLLAAMVAVVLWQWISDWRRGWIGRVSLAHTLIGGVSICWLASRTEWSPGQQVLAIIVLVGLWVSVGVRLDSWLKARFHDDESVGDEVK